MPGYRIFRLRNHHVQSVAEFEADDDAAALAHAVDLRKGEPAELWSGARLVRTFDREMAADVRPVGQGSAGS